MKSPRSVPLWAEAVLGLAVACAVTAAVVLGGRLWRGAPYSVGYSLHAAMCAAVIAVLAVGMAAVWAEHRGRRGAQWPGYAVAAALPAVAFGLPLARTPLWFGGLTLDQQFRTQFVTRLADQAAPSDMNYAGLPPYYPSGWFWPAAQLARLTGVEPWQILKPWSLLTFAAAAALAYTLWRLLAPRRALAVTVVSTLAVMFTSHQEPYSGALALLAPPVTVIAWHALRRGGRWPLACVAAALGTAFAVYTLYAAIAALTLAVLAVGARRAGTDLRTLIRRLALIGCGVVLAAPVWLPYLVRWVGAPAGGQAQEYLPTAGAAAWLAQFEPTPLGATCLVGTGWVLLRFGSDRRAQALAALLGASYAWIVASLAAAAFGSTLLGFRVIPLTYTAGAVAAVFAVDEALRWARPRLGRRTTARLVIVGGLAVTVALAQQATWQLTRDGALAYTDVACSGARADGAPPGPRGALPDVHATIARLTGHPARDTVVLPTDFALLACYPYRGFTSYITQYANPLAGEPRRKELVRSWSAARDSAELDRLLRASPVPPPSVFVFLRTPDGLRLDVTEDVYPADPNTRWTHLRFARAAVAGPEFTVRDVGPYTVAVHR